MLVTACCSICPQQQPCRQVVARQDVFLRREAPRLSRDNGAALPAVLGVSKGRPLRPLLSGWSCGLQRKSPQSAGWLKSGMWRVSGAGCVYGGSWFGISPRCACQALVVPACEIRTARPCWPLAAIAANPSCESLRSLAATQRFKPALPCQLLSHGHPLAWVGLQEPRLPCASCLQLPPCASRRHVGSNDPASSAALLPVHLRHGF